MRAQTYPTRVLYHGSGVQRAGYRESIRTAHCSAGQTSLSVRIVVSAVFRPRFQRVSHDSSTNASRTTAVVAARAVWRREGRALIEHVHVASSVFARVSGAGIQGLAGKAVGLAGPAHRTTTRCTFLSRYTPLKRVVFVC